MEGSKYKQVSVLVGSLYNEATKHNLQELYATENKNGEPIDEFYSKWDEYFQSLSALDQESFLNFLGASKVLVAMAEEAGHDCLVYKDERIVTITIPDEEISPRVRTHIQKQKQKKGEL